MGTKAVFAVSAGNNMHFKKILGMCMDGFPNNLEYIAHRFMEVAKQKRCLTRVRQLKFDAILEVMNAVEKAEKGWIFVDEIDNACWVSHSAIFNPATGMLQHFEGKFEDETNKFLIKTGRPKTREKKSDSLFLEPA